MNLGSKMVLDAMGRRGVGPGDSPRAEVESAPAGGRARAEERSVQAKARRAVAARELAGRLAGFRTATIVEETMLVVQVESSERGRPVIEALVADPVFAGLKLIAAVSPDVPFDDPTLLLWGIFTRFDAARDVMFTDVATRGAWASPGGRLGIDATWKPGYPEPVVMPEEIVQKVDARWGTLWKT
jgi:3-polyprenyl-4-hydroxybenzoate decarboxylase